jgi:hypothetical protein
MTPKPNLERGPWPWRWEPGNGFHNVAVHGRISAGFAIQTQMIDDGEYDRKPQLVARDLAIVMVMAARRAKRAGVELNFAEVAELARAELARLEGEAQED